MAWSCDNCHVVVKNDLICTRCGSAAAGADPQLVGLALQRDRLMEAHLSALALWYRIGAVLGVLFAVLLLVKGRALLGGEDFGSRLGDALTVIAGIAIAGCALSFVLGHFLSRYANWARVTAGVFAALTLAMQILGFASGLIQYASSRDIDMGGFSYQTGPSLLQVLIPGLLGIAWWSGVTWALLSRRSAHICDEGYRQLVAATSSLRPPTFRSPFFMIPLITSALGLGFLSLTLLARF